MVKTAGFGLIEVLVALTLLGVALLGVAGSTLLAARLLRRAEADERGAQLALQVLDSLAREPQPQAGARSVHPYHLVWQVHNDSAALRLLEVAVTYAEDTRRMARYQLAQQGAR